MGLCAKPKGQGRQFFAADDVFQSAMRYLLWRVFGLCVSLYACDACVFSLS